MKEYQREWYEKRRPQMLAYYRQKNYGVSPEQYQAMILAQDNKCAICKQPERALNRRQEIKELSVDHDHKTGQVRGLLCGACNIGIGTLGDDPNLLRAAADYLEASRTLTSIEGGGESHG